MVPSGPDGGCAHVFGGAVMPSRVHCSGIGGRLGMTPFRTCAPGGGGRRSALVLLLVVAFEEVADLVDDFRGHHATDHADRESGRSGRDGRAHTRA